MKENYIKMIKIKRLRQFIVESILIYLWSLIKKMMSNPRVFCNFTIKLEIICLSGLIIEERIDYVN